MALFKQQNTTNPWSPETKRALTPHHRMPQEWRCCLNWRGLVQHVSKKEEWKLTCVNVFTRVNKAVQFWPVFHLLTNTKPLRAWDQSSPLGRWSSNKLADLPSLALLGVTAASTNHLPLSCFLYFFTLPPHALGCNMWGALLPKLLKSFSFYGHLYPKSSLSRGDRSRFIIVPLTCLCLLRTLRPCVLLPTYWLVHTSKTTRRSSCLCLSFLLHVTPHGTYCCYYTWGVRCASVMDQNWLKCVAFCKTNVGKYVHTVP